VGRVCTDLVVQERVKIDAFPFFCPDKMHGMLAEYPQLCIVWTLPPHFTENSFPGHYILWLKFLWGSSHKRRALLRTLHSGTVGAYCHVLPAAVYNTLAFTCTAHWPVQLTDLYSSLTCTAHCHVRLQLTDLYVQVDGLYSSLACTADWPVQFMKKWQRAPRNNLKAMTHSDKNYKNAT
jgi:hypothetical protein